MGSGPSIKELSAADQVFLHDTDVLAINLWAYHPLTPTDYMYESSRDPKKHEAWFSLINSRAEQYKNVTFLLKHVPWFKRYGNLAEEFTRLHPNLLSRIRLFPITRQSYRSKEDIHAAPYEKLSVGDPMIQAKASVSSALSFAFAAGYRAVILYGFDLFGGHFWEENPSRVDHPTTLSRSGELTVADLITGLRLKLFLLHGREIYVGSRTSRLFPHLPLWRHDAA